MSGNKEARQALKVIERRRKDRAEQEKQKARLERDKAMAAITIERAKLNTQLAKARADLNKAELERRKARKEVNREILSSVKGYASAVSDFFGRGKKKSKKPARRRKTRR